MKKKMYKTPKTKVYPLEIEGYLLTGSGGRGGSKGFETTLPTIPGAIIGTIPITGRTLGAKTEQKENEVEIQDENNTI
ncbi:hypothetical protein [Prevotella aurantiaca]|uniref:hypothetical protein n=1 Tax=Prevotella aurantiaca TaxID=596085 RepID=UPI001CADFC03|nr:hypothetical protein [Prevotella aurantiaca]MBF1386210.1 hypothetical protein [Prevotella aurantiaca]